MSKYRFHLQKYSLGSKIACPSCERPRCFVKYVDEEGVVSFPNEVGKCDHEISCGYHYTPRDFFRDNPNANIKEERSSDYVQPVKSTHEKEIIVPPSFIPLEYFNASLAHFEKNPLYKYLCRVFGEAEAQGYSIYIMLVHRLNGEVRQFFGKLMLMSRYVLVRLYFIILRQGIGLKNPTVM